MTWVGVELDGSTFEPGEPVSGTFTVKAATKAREVRVQLDYIESTLWDRSTHIHGPEVVLPGGELAAGRRYPFCVELPADAQPTLTARDPAKLQLLGTASWYLVVRIDRFGPDDIASLAVNVTPR